MRCTTRSLGDPSRFSSARNLAWASTGHGSRLQPRTRRCKAIPWFTRRRPPAWRNLHETDAALLDFLRNRAASNELPPKQAVDKLLAYFREPGRFERLLEAAASEPPRVRAMLGAIGEQIGQHEHPRLSPAPLNPLSRFDFGVLSALAPCAAMAGEGAQGP